MNAECTPKDELSLCIRMKERVFDLYNFIIHFVKYGIIDDSSHKLDEMYNKMFIEAIIWWK